MFLKVKLAFVVLMLFFCITSAKGYHILSYYHLLLGWGSHYDNTDVPYITAAAAIGMTNNDITLFIKRLDKVLAQKTKEVSFKRKEIADHIEKNRILQPQSLNAKTSTQV